MAFVGDNSKMSETLFRSQLKAKAKGQKINIILSKQLYVDVLIDQASKHLMEAAIKLS